MLPILEQIRVFGPRRRRRRFLPREVCTQPVARVKQLVFLNDVAAVEDRSGLLTRETAVQNAESAYKVVGGRSDGLSST